ncbi:ABC transporter [Streptomyces sp. NPDC093225]|uniref:ABC transporter n=1 Tax=Streptomyces sp. NPDC093225 TaxID=3366034 RepID=UPI00381B0B45
MTALVRYHCALLLRSHRWLPPVLVYAAFLVIGLQAGQPVLDGFGYAAAALVPVSAWLVRVCVTVEPPAARHVLTAAVGPRRAHLASLVSAAGASTVVGLAGAAVIALFSDARSGDHRTAVPLGTATLAGVLTALCCVLAGVAVGTLTNRPLLRSPAWGIPVGAASALLLLVTGASPANAAVAGMVTGSAHGVVHVPLFPLLAAALGAAGAVAVACAVSPWRE